MSKPVPSDGNINRFFEELVKRGFNNYSKSEIDDVLIEPNLKQCQYEVLVSIQNEYCQAFKDKNWVTHSQIIIKAEQSAKWRNWRDVNLNRGRTKAQIIDKSVDPLKEIQRRQGK